MNDPTDNEIIMFISIAKAVERTVKSPAKRKIILETITKFLTGYNKLTFEARSQMVKQFKDNVKEMELSNEIKEQVNG